MEVAKTMKQKKAQLQNLYGYVLTFVLVGLKEFKGNPLILV